MCWRSVPSAGKYTLAEVVRRLADLGGQHHRIETGISCSDQLCPYRRLSFCLNHGSKKFTFSRADTKRRAITRAVLTLSLLKSGSRRSHGIELWH